MGIKYKVIAPSLKINVNDTVSELGVANNTVVNNTVVNNTVLNNTVSELGVAFHAKN